ncbi:Uma2 family endonuclease [Paraburkholderia phytofirmans]|uniref:Uma2 family endonuclease n=1 Tax=Paraburkholderia phytofirmans TaxID=261302 RepID=UPI001F3310BA|nr:Uma2 family endonuclease [Paraburkholderia phytofirmans]
MDRNALIMMWQRLTVKPDVVQWYPYELNECGEIVANACPSARRQIVLTDVYVQLNERLGHLAAMSVAVTTLCFGIMVPDVVWMLPEKWEDFDRDDPVPFVPDLCVEVLLDSERQQNIAHRVHAYLEGGAREVIVVGPDGKVEFWGAEGLRQTSMFEVVLSLDSGYFEVDGAIAEPNGVRS